MNCDGKQLESFVAFTEKLMLPEGFHVTTNNRVYDNEGDQIAELDINIHGKIGSTEISWLIECRDRPARGKSQPVSWIEQLVTRRNRLNFNKATAVSTTGFSPAAVKLAFAEGIDLREINSLDPSEFTSWLKVSHITENRKLTHFEEANIIIGDPESKKALDKLLNTVDGNSKILESVKTGERISLSQAFLRAATGIKGIFDRLEPNKESCPLKFTKNYPEEECFFIKTERASIKVREITFRGTISLKSTERLLLNTSEYRKVDTGEIISQTAVFAPQTIDDTQFSMELHKIEGTEEIHVNFRSLNEKG